MSNSSEYDKHEEKKAVCINQNILKTNTKKRRLILCTQ